MDGFIKLLKMQVADTYADDNDASTFDNIRRVICNIFRLFAQRYEEDFGPYMMNAISTVWQLLVDTDHRIRFDSLVNSALGFLSAVSEKDRYLEIFNQPGVLEAICENVIIKNLMLRREDLEQFEDEPFDYLKRDIEGIILEIWIF
jgi:exportin-2 (importin alpha re-exporter)